MTSAPGKIDFSAFEPVDADPIVTEMPEAKPDDTFDYPDSKFIPKQTRPSGAVKYERKTRALLNIAMRSTVESPQTVADAAAIIMYGPTLAEKMGNLAATDERVARGIDFITEGTENPYAAVAFATFPLVLQVLRNHEPQIEIKPRGIKIPFSKGKRLNFKFGVKLGKLRRITNDPEAFTKHVMNPEILDALRKQGVNVASVNGRKT